jgi:hypothetical protein
LFLKDASEDQVKDLSLPTEGSVDLNLAGKWGQIIESYDKEGPRGFEPWI